MIIVLSEIENCPFFKTRGKLEILKKELLLLTHTLGCNFLDEAESLPTAQGYQKLLLLPAWVSGTTM